jgi:hypothetical protein
MYISKSWTQKKQFLVKRLFHLFETSFSLMVEMFVLQDEVYFIFAIQYGQAIT